MLFTKPLVLLTTLLASSLANASAIDRRAQVAARTADGIEPVIAPPLTNIQPVMGAQDPATAPPTSGDPGATIAKRSWDQILDKIQEEAGCHDYPKTVPHQSGGTFVQNLMDIAERYTPNANRFIYLESKDLNRRDPNDFVEEFHHLNVWEKWFIIFDTDKNTTVRYKLVVFFGEGSITNNGEFGSVNWYLSGNWDIGLHSNTANFHQIIL